ncbi:MAG TPA: hypothetical protein VGL83_18145 [Stellaceae bacterium]|jgi:hypothetical protein
MRYLGLILLGLALAGCASPAIPMLDPATGARADCGSHPEFWLLNASSLPGEEMACQSDYEARGWVRAPLHF